MAQFGIRKFESKRLILYTDIAPKNAQPLPALMDAAFEAWEAYFGKLLPNRERTDYQMTGYIMADKSLFQRVGLLPADLPFFPNGRHRGAEFWMSDQQDAYYRRHLMIHEATHCFMTTMPGIFIGNRPDVGVPVWYMEGMAELFGTHWTDAKGKTKFRVMPHEKSEFAGLGRIRMLRDDKTARKSMSFSDVRRLLPNDFVKDERYAWSWALCKFLDSHPRYQERFRKLGSRLEGSQFAPAFIEIFGDDLPNLAWEWSLFAHNLSEGYDATRAAIDFRPGTQMDVDTGEKTVEILANRGWQSSGVLVEKDREYEITATGRFTLAQKPKPWISEPQGISFRYFNGRPLGLLLGTIHPRVFTTDDGNRPPSVITIGPSLRIKPAQSGTLYLRLNDAWNQLADNKGKVQVRIARVAE